ncbi:hypothetical protein ccbrp13_48960 [Ktedonobacteria bacterium brp13]|nr:hypothetical protein ccbrp13_48960 [Ktedonobacteria bacterium brp13]
MYGWSVLPDLVWETDATRNKADRACKLINMFTVQLNFTLQGKNNLFNIFMARYNMVSHLSPKKGCVGAKHVRNPVP